MKFFNLTHTEYYSDQQFSKANPVETDSENYLPGIDCQKCDEQWASSRRARFENDVAKKISQYLKKNEISNFLSVEEWERVSTELSAMTGVPREVFQPGTEFGPPKGILKKNEVNDFLHPFPGQIWVTFDVVSAIKEAQLTGVDFAKVELKREKKKGRIFEGELPEFWEIVITGRAWREGMDLENVTVCEECKRTIFPDPNILKVDVKTWDGTDFLNLDTNPNIVVVTERVSEVLQRNTFTNFSCLPI